MSWRTTKRAAEEVSTAQDTATLPVRAKDDEPAQHSLPAGEGNLTVFTDSDGERDDDDSPAAPVVAATETSTKSKGDESRDEEDEEDSEEDDEAPEAVSTQAAASLAKKSSQVAQRAAQEYVKTHPWHVDCPPV